MKLITLSVILALFGAKQCQGACSKTSTNYIFHTVDSVITWSTADSNCQSWYGTRLASVTTSSERSEAEQLARDCGATDDSVRVCIGGYRSESCSSSDRTIFSWLNGESWTSFNEGGDFWASNQPNNCDDDCVGLRAKDDFLAADIGCSETSRYHFICNQPPATPSPTTDSPTTPSPVTSTPTAEPTPTFSPSPAPTPTESPTPAPVPTPNPTDVPTPKPTTGEPTPPPTTSAPTLKPSDEPTDMPTRLPTKAPLISLDLGGDGDNGGSDDSGDSGDGNESDGDADGGDTGDDEGSDDSGNDNGNEDGSLNNGNGVGSSKSNVQGTMNILIALVIALAILILIVAVGVIVVHFRYVRPRVVKLQMVASNSNGSNRVRIGAASPALSPSAAGGDSSSFPSMNNVSSQQPMLGGNHHGMEGYGQVTGITLATGTEDTGEMGEVIDRMIDDVEEGDTQDAALDMMSSPNGFITKGGDIPSPGHNIDAVENDLDAVNQVKKFVRDEKDNAFGRMLNDIGAVNSMVERDVFDEMDNASNAGGPVVGTQGGTANDSDDDILLGGYGDTPQGPLPPNPPSKKRHPPKPSPRLRPLPPPPPSRPKKPGIPSEEDPVKQVNKFIRDEKDREFGNMLNSLAVGNNLVEEDIVEELADPLPNGSRGTVTKGNVQELLKRGPWR